MAVYYTIKLIQLLVLKEKKQYNNHYQINQKARLSNLAFPISFFL